MAKQKEKGQKKNKANDNGEKKRSYKSRIVWEDTWETLLLQLWRERAIDLRKAKRNQHIYMEMSQEFKKNNINLTAGEVKTKIDNLTRQYRTEKKAIGSTGGSPSNWMYYDEIDAIIGTHPMSNVRKLTKESLDLEDIMSNPSSSPMSAQVVDHDENFVTLNVPVIDDEELLNETHDNPPEEESFDANQDTEPPNTENGSSQKRKATEDDGASKKKKRKNQDSTEKLLMKQQETLEAFVRSQLEKENERNQILKDAEDQKIELLREKNAILREAQQDTKRANERRNNLLETIVAGMQA